jgi:hypothetical protein
MEKGLLNLFIEIGERKDWDEYYAPSEILRSRIECYAEKLMDGYDPASPVWDFQLYLLKWLENAETIEEKFLLLNSLSFFSFFNRDQCNALYLEALHGPILRWLIEINNLDILDNDINDKINECVEPTFISAATDSTDISAMRHVCDLQINHTKIWHSYINKYDSEEQKNGKIESCKNDLHNWGYKQIVVLEDFIGTGKQSKAVIDFLGNFPEWRIIFIPLIICPQGDIAITEHLRTKKYDHISYEPISKMPWELILADDRPIGSKSPPLLLAKLKEYAREIHTRVIGTESDGSAGYLGFKDTGALFAKYTNCPDNTLPLYHYKRNEEHWSPLFPRSDR